MLRMPSVVANLYNGKLDVNTVTILSAADPTLMDNLVLTNIKPRPSHHHRLGNNFSYVPYYFQPKESAHASSDPEN